MQKCAYKTFPETTNCYAYTGRSYTHPPDDKLGSEEPRARPKGARPPQEPGWAQPNLGPPQEIGRAQRARSSHIY